MNSLLFEFDIMLVFIFIYAILLILIGALIGRKAKSSSDFFVAGRKLNSGLLFTTLIAANLGAGSTVGVAALAYKFGISAWWWIGSAGIGSLILAFIVGPRIWRIAREKNFYTLSDYLDSRYSKIFSGIIAIMMSIGTLALFAGQLLGIAWILEVVAEIPKTQGVIIAIGMSAYNPNQDDCYKQIFERADTLMYQRKKELKGQDAG